MASFQPREITFEQIRANDELLITQINGKMETTKRANVITKYGTGAGEQWVNEDDMNVISYSQTQPSTAAVITLLNREVPEAWEADDENSFDIEVHPWNDGVKVFVSDFDGGAFVELHRENTVSLRDYLTTVLEG